jgi:hypothetical protein
MQAHLSILHFLDIIYIQARFFYILSEAAD